ncbi:MAG: hypothetical protein C0446_08345 [Chitinophaga sp.]|nr:hypothetical protein [Chitinophaga sp.]
MSLFSDISSLFNSEEKVATETVPSISPVLSEVPQSYAPEPETVSMKMEDPQVIEQQLTQQMTDPFDSQRAFNYMWNILLKNEGGYTNTLNDGAGETNFGVTKRSYPHLDIKNITENQAKEIFKNDFYDKVGGDRLAAISEPLAMHVSDMAYNAGPGTAIKLLYRAAGLPESTKISDELFQALNSDQSLVDSFVKQRLAYYSTRANAPRFIKSWTNRVDHINKMYGNKSGMGGVFQAARDMDTQAIVAGSAQDSYLDPAFQFSELTPEEVSRLTADQQQSILTDSPAVVDSDKPISSLGDVFQNTVRQKFFNETITGIQIQKQKAALLASEANRKAVQEAGGTIADDIINSAKEALEKMSFGFLDLGRNDVRSVDDFEKEVKKLKEKYPDIKLPYETSDQVYKLASQHARQIEKSYEDTESGRLIGGSASETFTKLGHVIAGYLPGYIVGSLGDPYETASMAFPLGNIVKSGQVTSSLVKSILSASGAVTAVQAGVEYLRPDVGLDGDLAKAPITGLAAGVGVGTLGLAGFALSKLFNASRNSFRYSSSQAAKELDESAELVSKALKEENLDTNNLYLQRAAEDIKVQAQEYRTNPIGEDYQAKVKFEEAAEIATKQVEADEPVTITTKTRKFIEEPKQDFTISDMFDEDDVMTSYFKSAEKEWQEIKKDAFVDSLEISKREDLIGKVNLQPKIVDGAPLTFTDQQNLNKFLKSAQGKKALLDGDTYVILEDDGTLSVMKSLDVEPTATRSTRFLDDNSNVVEDVIGTNKISRHKDVDIEGAKVAPERTLISTLDLKPETLDIPAVNKIRDDLAIKEVVNRSNRIAKERLDDLESTIQKLVDESPDLKVDLEDDLGVVESRTVHKIRSELKEERQGLKEFADCINKPSVEG